MLPLVTLILFCLTSLRKGPNNAIASSRAKSQKTELLSSKMDSHKPLRRYVVFVKYFFEMDVINIVVKGYCVRLGSRVFKYFFKTWNYGHWTICCFIVGQIMCHFSRYVKHFYCIRRLIIWQNLANMRTYNPRSGSCTILWKIYSVGY